MAFCAVQAGIDPAEIECSDVSLFTTVLGYHITGQSIESLGIKFDGQPFTGTMPELLYQVAVVDAKIEDQFREALKSIGKSYDIKAATPIVCKMIDLLTGTEGQSDWVYITDIFGPRVPKEVATILRQAIEKMKKSGEITDKNKWQILEYLFADYLGK